MFADECPAGGHDVRRAGHLEIVHIDREEQVELGVEEAGAPIGDGLETHRPEVRFTMLLPVTPRIWVAIESQHQRADRITKTGPRFGPLVTRQTHPGGRVAGELRLNVGSLSVALFSNVTREQPEGIACLSGLHGSRGTAHVIEESSLPLLVAHIVALEDNAALVLAIGVPSLKLGALLDADREDQTYMGLLTRTPGLVGHSAPLPDAGFIPAASSAKLIPLLLNRCLSGWSVLDLALVHSARDARIERKGRVLQTLPVLGHQRANGHEREVIRDTGLGRRSGGKKR